MQATTTLPSTYELKRELDFSKSVRLTVFANLLGVVLIFVFGALAIRIARWIRPEVAMSVFTLEGYSALVVIAAAVVLIVLLLVLHELVHGAFFWVFTRTRPVFGFKGVYAYAGAPRWYIPRNRYFVVGLAPLVVLSLVCLALLSFVPPAGVPVLVLSGVANAAGAVGDLIIAAWLLTYPKDALVRDTGDVIRFYGPLAD